jgi:voltage-gated potassium channel Kch
MAFCLAFQCLVLGILFDILLILEKKRLIKTTLFGFSSLLIVLLLIMLVGNLLQITLWAGLFFAYGEFADFATAFYHSVVNFATLGYGDLVMSEQRRLLGALEAVNGVLMFGLTTGFLFAVLWALLQREWEKRVSQDA